MTARPAAARAVWIHRPAVDIAVALCWVPFALVGHYLEASPQRLGDFVGAVFLLSFAHQPLTLPLVYGDPGQFALRRRLFTWSPIVFGVAILAGMSVSLAVVAVVAGLWNAEHTLMQRYGITRIYGRKVGDDDGRLEKAMLLSWLVLALVWAAADAATPDRVRRVPLGRINSSGLNLLADLRPVAAVLVVPAVVVAVGLAVAWFCGERLRAGAANRAKHLYVLSTAVLFVAILVDPVAGFLGYVGAHAVEYFVIVNRALGSRYADGSGGPLGAVVRSPGGRRRFMAAYAAAVGLLAFALLRFGSNELYGFTVLFLGGLHVFYDGFIWKLRRPAVARGFALAPAAT